MYFAKYNGMSKSDVMVLNFYLKNFSNICRANILFGTQKTGLVCKGQFFYNYILNKKHSLQEFLYCI